jgi:putative endonuclease
MASVYILYSAEIDRFYIGSCENLQIRLSQHLNHKFSDSYTSKATDWILFFALDKLDYKQARLIEAHIKKMRTRTYYQNLKTYPEISEKLIEKYK